MESALRKANQYPTLESPALDVETFVERHLRIYLDQEADLNSSILGITEFPPKSKPIIISISAELTKAAIDHDGQPLQQFGRWRATVAHEAAHAMLHETLFKQDHDQMSLFEHSPSEQHNGSLFRCLKRDVAFSASRNNVDWREYQASTGMAALLMPKGVFCECTHRILRDWGVKQSDPVPNSELTMRLTSRLAGLFQVSHQAAGIRLKNLEFVNPPGKSLALFPG